MAVQAAIQIQKRIIRSCSHTESGATVMRKLIFAAGTLLFGGCALMDTGEIEYRRAEPPASEFTERIQRARSWELLSRCDAVDASQAAHEEREPRNLGVDYRRWACIPLFPARLIRRNASIGDPIEPNDVYSIRIDHGVIAEMIETPFSFRRLLSGREATRRVGEIAILANTFEFAAPNGEGSDPSDFVNLSNLTGVKVVYYNPDVEQGQALNFSNIPLTEGRRYTGRPVGIQIVVLELDRMSGPMQNLMRTLASIGQQSSVLPSGVATQALLELGTSLISQENDDVIFEYRFVLDRSDGTDSVAAPPFEAGRYVVRRTHERRRTPRWDDLILDHNTGQLMRRHPVLPTPTSEEEAYDRHHLPFEEDTYFTLNVVRHEDDGAFAYDPQTFQQLDQEITDAAAERDAPLNSVTERLEEAVISTRNRHFGNDLVEAWRRAATRYRTYARHYADESESIEGVGTVCELREDPDRYHLRQEALFEARAAATDFIALYDRIRAQAEAPENSGGSDEGSTPPLFTEDVQRRVLVSLGSFFAPFPSEVPVTQAILTDPDGFRSNFTGAKISDFLDAAERAAELNWAPRSCQALIAARLARRIRPQQADAATTTEEELN